MSMSNRGSKNGRNGRKSRRRNKNQEHHDTVHHGSAMPVPHSRSSIRRERGVLSEQIKSSMEASTYQRVQRDPIQHLRVGAPYNEYHSFFSTSSPDEILNELTLIFKSQPDDLDVNIHPTGYKIRGRKFINNIMCEFQVEMFYVTSKHNQYPNHILVEFQRRNGDGLVFQQFLNSIFTELNKTQIIKFTKFPTTRCDLSPKPLVTPLHGCEEEKKEYKSSQSEPIDSDTLEILIAALFDGDCSMRRSSATYLANNIANNIALVRNIMRLEPHIITKFSDLLLKCVDPQIVRSIGCTLYYMLEQSNQLKDEALKLNVKTVCKKVLKRWTEPVETRYGSNNKYVIRVIPSLQVAQRMSACIQVLE
eukprot:169778_1